ncbi:hypothetical protein [Streptomyces cyanogenus]|uniref:Uncharacterized protein n=1 Tax=Streptomyces cyanogenus TaxID=80860 RepID=A0ABX7U4D4_STRCY|nr:hypothetical protein S1361_31555 [Streptomyces cyanogenus]
MPGGKDALFHGGDPDADRRTARTGPRGRPNWFNQHFDEGVLLDGVLAGELRLPAGDGREPFADADDVAAVATAALLADGHAGRPRRPDRYGRGQSVTSKCLLPCPENSGQAGLE